MAFLTDEDLDRIGVAKTGSVWGKVASTPTSAPSQLSTVEPEPVPEPAPTPGPVTPANLPDASLAADHYLNRPKAPVDAEAVRLGGRFNLPATDAARIKPKLKRQEEYDEYDAMLSGSDALRIAAGQAPETAVAVKVNGQTYKEYLDTRIAAAGSKHSESIWDALKLGGKAFRVYANKFVGDKLDDLIPLRFSQPDDAPMVPTTADRRKLVDRLIKEYQETPRDIRNQVAVEFVNKLAEQGTNPVEAFLRAGLITASQPGALTNMLAEQAPLAAQGLLETAVVAPAAVAAAGLRAGTAASGMFSSALGFGIGGHAYGLTSDYINYRSQGLSDKEAETKARQKAGVRSLVNAALAAVPGGALAAKSPGSAVLAAPAIQGVAGAASEVTAGAAVGEETSIGEAALEFWGEVASPFNYTEMALSTAIEARYAAKEEAKATYKALTDAVNALNASKEDVGSRTEESVLKALNERTGSDDVFINGEILGTLLAEADITPAKLAQDLGDPDYEAIFNAAMESGDDVTLSLGKLLARARKEEYLPVLLRGVRSNPDGLSAEEASAAAFDVADKAERKRLEDIRHDNVVRLAQFKAVQADVRKQLTTIGRGMTGIPANVVDQNAQLDAASAVFARVFESMAEAMGVPLRALYEAISPTFVASQQVKSGERLVAPINKGVKKVADESVIGDISTDVFIADMPLVDQVAAIIAETEAGPTAKLIQGGQSGKTRADNRAVRQAAEQINPEEAANIAESTDLKTPGAKLAQYVELILASKKGAVTPEPVQTKTRKEVTRAIGGAKGLKVSLGMYLPEFNAIVLAAKGNNLTTFIHETAHFYLENIMRAANQGLIDQEKVQPVLDWFDFKGTAGDWLATNLNDRRKSHERFAYGAMQYVFEGKAPHAELEKDFAQFVQAFTHIYSSIDAVLAKMEAQGAAEGWTLTAEERLGISDEIRQVMDMMVAANQLAEVSLVQENAKLFDTVEQAEDLGFPAEAAQKYLDAYDKYEAAVKGDLFSGAMKQFELVRTKLRAMTVRATAEAQRLERRIYDEELAKVYATTVPQPSGSKAEVGKLVRSLTLTGDAEVDGVKPFKLHIDEMENRFGRKKPATKKREEYVPEWYALRTRGGRSSMFAKEVGDKHIDVDVAAAMFGFDTADEMVNALVDFGDPKTRAKAEVERRMLEEHPAFSSPDAIEASVKEALKGEAWNRFTKETFKLLESITGTRSFDLAAAKHHAEIAAGETLLGDLSGNLALSHERQARAANKRFFASMKAGDPHAALQAKLMAHRHEALAKALREAMVDREKANKTIRRIWKRRGTGQIGAEYQDLIDALMVGYGIRKPDGLKLNVRSKADFRAKVAALEEKYAATIVDPLTIENLGETAISDMTVEEFLMLKDSLLRLDTISREEARLLALSELETNLEFAGRLIDETLESGKYRKTEGDVIGKPDTLMDSLRGVHMELRSITSLLNELGGGKQDSAWIQLAYALRDAAAEEAEFGEQAGQTLNNAFKHFNTDKEEVYRIPGTNVRVNKTAVIAMLLNWGNLGNRERLKAGYEWATDESAAYLFSKLSDADIDAAESVWALMEGIKQKMTQVERDMTGADMKFVEPEPFEVIRPLAVGEGVTTTRKLAGGYLPIVYTKDMKSDQRGNTEKKDGTPDSETSGVTSEGKIQYRLGETGKALLGMFKASFLKDRAVLPTGGTIVLDNLGLVASHILEASHVLTHKKLAQDLGKVLNLPGVRQSIVDTHGKEMANTVYSNINVILNGRRPLTSKIIQGINYVRQGTQVAGLGFNIGTVLLQPLGVFQALGRYQNSAEGLKAFTEATTYILNGDITRDQINELSTFMRTRHHTHTREIHESRTTMRRNRIAQAQGKVADLSMMPIGLAQAPVDTVVWATEYLYVSGKFPDLSEKQRIQAADEAVAASQGSGLMLDESGFRLKYPEAGRFLSMFMTFFQKTFDIMAESKALYKNAAEKDKAMYQLLARMAFLLVIPAVTSAGLDIIAGKVQGRDDDDDENLWKLASSPLTYAMSSVMLLREATAWFTEFDYSGPAATRVFASGERAMDQLSQGEVDGPFMKAWATFLGILAGLPLSKPMGYAVNMTEQFSED